MAKRKKKGQSARVQKKKTLASSSENPFEKKVHKQKFEIMGRRVRGAEQNVVRSREKAIENRKRTLLLEYQQRSKKNRFVDTRLGESDASISQEEKDLLRFQKEVQKRYAKKKKKASLYNLEDDDDEMLGNSLGNDDYIDSDENGSDEEEFDKEMMDSLQFGGFEKNDKSGELDQEERAKTRQEVIEEIIAKSKTNRREKAKQKEQDEEIKEQIDQQFNEIQSLLSKRDKTKDKDFKHSEKFEDFDSIVKELTFEPRARAGERLKTTEELAKEERERLEKLERERLQRMNEPEEDVKKQKHVSADDLGDDFVIENTYQPENSIFNLEEIEKKQKQHKEEEKEEEEDEDEEEDEGEDDVLESEEEEEEDNEENEGEESDEEKDIEEEQEALEQSDKKHAIDTKSKQIEDKEEKGIPFTIDVPHSYDGFVKLIEKRNLKERAAIIHRIRVCNHISLGPQNKEKLQNFFSILLQHFEKLSEAKTTSMIEINLVSKHLFELSELFPTYSGKVFQEKVSSIFQNIVQGSQEGKQLSWSKKKELFLFRLIGNIFPVSDFQHSVVTPTLLIMCGYLLQSPVKTGNDIAKALFLCNIILYFLTPSKRFCPEVINFLNAILVSVHAKPKLHTIKKNFLELNDPTLEIEKKPLSIELLHTKNTELFSSDEFKMNVIYLTLNLLEDFANLYSEQPAVVEIFSPTKTVLTELKKIFQDNKIMMNALCKLDDKLQEITTHSYRTRKPIQQDRKPLSIREFRPKFEDKSSMKKEFDEDKQKEQIKKLKRNLKSEKRGAVRELRRDNLFLSAEKAKEKREEIEERENKRKKIMSILQSEQHEFKQQKKLQEKLKKRNSKF